LYRLLSGLSADFRDLQQSTHPAAAFAIDVFAYRVAGAIAAPIRRAILARCAWLGVSLDEVANASDATRISARDSRIVVCVIPTSEETIIARHTATMLF
jgi:acetate kinase